MSIQLVDAWAPKTLPSVSYAVVIRDEDFLLQTLMTRMVGPLWQILEDISAKLLSWEAEE